MTRPVAASSSAKPQSRARSFGQPRSASSSKGNSTATAAQKRSAASVKCGTCGAAMRPAMKVPPHSAATPTNRA